ncbi:uncharacterized protein [Oscarella lobularis]|uniref:uncharacterized protein n=1 Tax=Oscarella lobularis TaxID=121494 RepID=UPI00331338C4
MALKSSSTPLDVVDRVILVIGKTGHGKSTLANYIVGEKKFRATEGPDQGTPACSHWECSIELVRDGKPVACRVKVIDTPGYMHEETESRCRDQLKGVKEYIQKHAPLGVNTVLIAWKTERMTKTLRKSLKLMKSDMKLDTTCFAIALTNCDGYSDEERQSTIDTFFNHEKLRNVSSLIKRNEEGGKRRYITVGFQDTKKLKEEMKKPFEEENAKEQDELRKFLLLNEHFREKKLKHEIFSLPFWERIRDWLHHIFS